MIDDARSLWDLIDRRAAATPDAVMLYDGDRTTTFAEYRDWCERVAAGLSEQHGVGEGTAVSWQLPTWSEAAVLVGALARLGAVQNPMLPIYREREVRFIAGQTNCELLIVPTVFRDFDHEALAREVAAERPGMAVLVADKDLPEGDPAKLAAPAPGFNDAADDPVRWIFYTSGTTSDPKGAQHTDRTIMATAIGYCRRAQVGETDKSLVAFPFTHVGGIIIGIYQANLTGAGSVLMETFTPQLATELIGRHGITFPNGAPAIHQLLLEEARAHPEAYVQVRCFPSGGASKPPQLHEDLKVAVPGNAGIVSGYGLTEMPILVQTAIDDPDESRRDAEGLPQDGVTIKLLDRDGNEVPEGELVAKGPMLMRGYLDESLNADAYTSDRFFRTGDLAKLDPNGAVIITGRLKDVIIRKGENISAKEVEDVLFTMAAVADVAVIGLPDPSSGERCVAVVQPDDAAAPPTLADVVEHCKAAGLMTQKIPEQLEIVDALPRSPSGKVPKHVLQAQFAPA